ncbi:MAG: MATE family efflux transporter [Planctomycetaceae bacterium]|nr:MATE family efflux transporter [Planctomycetaceae bacterium]
MKKSAFKSLDMTQGAILPTVVSFAIPLLIGSLFQTLYNTVDTLIIGNFVGTEALAAVGACNSPMLILLSVMLGLSGGVSVLVSQVFGSGDARKVERVIATANGFFLLSVVPITVCAVLLIEPLLSIINIQDVARGHAVMYLSVVFGGLVGAYGYNLNSGILRGLGDSRSPLLFLLVAFIVNVVLDLFFVLVMGWGVFGVSIATVSAQVVSWLYSLHHIKRHYSHLNYRVFTLRVDGELIKRMISLSLPMVVNHAVFSVGFLFYYRFVIGLGSAYMAGYSIAGKLENMTWLPISSLGMAAVTFAGQNAGAGKVDALSKGARLFTKTAVLFNLTTAAVTLLFGRWLLGLFSPDQAVVDAGYRYLTFLMPFYWVYAIIHMLTSFMNGVGDVRVPTWITMIMFWVVRVPLAWYISSNYPGSYLHLAYPASWIIGCTLTVAYFMTGRWKRQVTAIAVTGSDQKSISHRAA